MDTQPLQEPATQITWWTKLTQPQYFLHRTCILLLICFMNFGNYFVYDTPSSLQDKIIHDMDQNMSSYNTLYGYYSWPNVILSFFGGYLVDKIFGVRLGSIIFLTFITVGHCIVSFGAFINHFWLMQLGRFIFGIGGESLAVVQNAYLCSWFSEKELNIAFGLSLSTSRLGSTANFYVMTFFYDKINYYISGYKCLGLTLSIGVSTCIFSLIIAALLAYLDRRGKRILGKQEANSGEVVKISDVLHFNAQFWLISAICVFYYVTIFPFIGLIPLYLMNKFDEEENYVNKVTSSLVIISTILSPLIGYIIDKVGRNLFFIFAAVLLTCIGHALIAYTYVRPLVPVCILGLGYSIVACSLWPLVNDVVAPHLLGTAYGAIQSIQNLGLAIASILTSQIVDHMGYFTLENFFLISLFITQILLIIILLVDSIKKGTLNISAKKRLNLEKQKQSVIETE